MKRVCENCVMCAWCEVDGTFVCCDQAMKPIKDEKTETCENWQLDENQKKEGAK